ncbi:MAG: sulfotransferase [Lapillicoccus sp.]
MHLADNRLVFVGGLHRSGTTPLARCLAGHPEVSGFSGTGVKEDEGQHLQSVYPTARDHGGPGRFAGAAAAHLTEESDLATEANAERLFEQWRPHWDLTRPVLLEKSPPNLLMMRFLQAMYPEASFVMAVRHPVTVALSTRKWVGGSWGKLLDNWFRAHDVFSADAPHIRRLRVVKYEDLVTQAAPTLAAIATFLGLHGAVAADGIEQHRSVAYESQWRQLKESARPWDRRTYRSLCRDYESRANHYGYSLEDLEYCAPFPTV